MNLSEGSYLNMRKPVLFSTVYIPKSRNIYSWKKFEHNHWKQRISQSNQHNESISVGKLYLDILNNYG